MICLEPWSSNARLGCMEALVEALRKIGIKCAGGAILRSRQGVSEHGSTTHFILTASAAAKFGNIQLGVNVRLADERDLAEIELRYPDGQSWSGKGEFAYVREARIIGR